MNEKLKKTIIHFLEDASYPKKCAPKSYDWTKKENPICQIFHKKIRKFWFIIDLIADVFLNLANFAQHKLLNLAPPSSYTLNLKPLIDQRVKNSLTYQLSYKVCDLHFKENSEKTNFISPQYLPKPKSPSPVP